MGTASGSMEVLVLTENDVYTSRLSRDGQGWVKPWVTPSGAKFMHWPQSLCDGRAGSKQNRVLQGLSSPSYPTMPKFWLKAQATLRYNNGLRNRKNAQEPADWTFDYMPLQSVHKLASSKRQCSPAEPQQT